MFARVSIPISKQIYEVAWPTIYVCRFFGLFPVQLQKEKDEIYLQWSLRYTAYSIFVGITLAVLTYRGILEDILCDRKDSVRIKADVDMYVVFTDLSGVHLIMLFGIFNGVYKISEAFKFIKYLGEVDILMHLNHTHSTRRTSLCAIFVILFITITMSVIDVLMYFRNGDDNIRSKVIRRYLTVYFTYCVVMMTQYKFWYLANSVLRRMQQINETLNCRTQKDERLLSVDYVIAITTAYVKLSDATKSLNLCSGIINAITMLDLFWHFVEAPFHLLLGIIGPKRDALYILITVAWNLFHLSRLLVLVAPCNSCKLEMQKMKNLVCKLLYSGRISQECKLQLQTLCKVLEVCKLQFNAAGFKEIECFLIIGILGTVSTFLVVLIQFENK